MRLAGGKALNELTSTARIEGFSEANDLAPDLRPPAPLRDRGGGTQYFWGGLPMITRRSFIKNASATATGIAFCSCGLLDAAAAQQPAKGSSSRHQRQAHQDHRRPRSLPDPRGLVPSRRRSVGAHPANQERGRSLYRPPDETQRDERAGRRYGGAFDQSVLVR
jgi:hypothetical protein